LLYIVCSMDDPIVMQTKSHATAVFDRRDPIYGLGTAVCLIASLVLVAKWCQDCSSHYPWGVFQALVLPIAGLVYAVGSALLWVRIHGNPIPGAGTRLVFLSGIILIGIGLVGNVRPCPFCIAFWAGVTLQLLSLHGTAQVEKLFNICYFAAICSMAIANLWGPSRGLVSSYLPQVVPGRLGLLPGEPISLMLGLPSTGTVVIGKDCPVCWRDRMIKLLQTLDRSHTVVLYSKQEPVWASGFKTMRIPEESFRYLNLDATGVPFVLETKEGRVVKMQPMSVTGDSN
jgi:hypothetical protein